MRPRILLLRPGPVYTPEATFRTWLEGMSSYFTGSFVAFGSTVSSPSPGAELYRSEMGSFGVHILRRPRGRLARVREMLGKIEELGGIARRQGTRYDLISSYDPLFTGLVALRAASRLGARLVVEVNGDLSAASNYADVRNPLFRALKRRLYMTVGSFVLHRADGIHLGFPTQLDGWRDVRSKLVAAFPNYVNPAAFPNRGETKEVLLVGFPLYVKGVDILVDAFARVSDGFPDWHLKILGWYAGEEKERLTRAIGNHPRIRHHPPVSYVQAAEHIGRCGILVLPSRTEGVSRVLLEAMAAGKPRIGTRVGGTATVIEDGVDGLLVPPEDPGALAEALARLMGDPATRESMGRNGALRSRGEFSAESFFLKQRDFYHRVLGSVPSEPGRP